MGRLENLRWLDNREMAVTALAIVIFLYRFFCI
jgi:hypothetical protein